MHALAKMESVGIAIDETGLAMKRDDALAFAESCGHVFVDGETVMEWWNTAREGVLRLLEQC
jgi:hypothetical protein